MDILQELGEFGDLRRGNHNHLVDGMLVGRLADFAADGRSGPRCFEGGIGTQMMTASTSLIREKSVTAPKPAPFMAAISPCRMCAIGLRPELRIDPILVDVETDDVEANATVSQCKRDAESRG